MGRKTIFPLGNFAFYPIDWRLDTLSNFKRTALTRALQKFYRQRRVGMSPFRVYTHIVNLGHVWNGITRSNSTNWKRKTLRSFVVAQYINQIAENFGDHIFSLFFFLVVDTRWMTHYLKLRAVHSRKSLISKQNSFILIHRFVRSLGPIILFSSLRLHPLGHQRRKIQLKQSNFQDVSSRVKKKFNYIFVTSDKNTRLIL